MTKIIGQPLVGPDTQISSYGEWLLLNGKTSLDDLENICKEFFIFVYGLALILLNNADLSRFYSLEALANALYRSRLYPGGSVLAWLARHTLVACSRRIVSKRNFTWAELADPQEAKIWQVVRGLDPMIQVQAVLFFRSGLPRDEISIVFKIPTWSVENNLQMVRDLCTRQLQWSGMRISQGSVEKSIGKALAHQLPTAGSAIDQPRQLASDLAATFSRKVIYQKRLALLQQTIVAVILFVILIAIYLK